ncbi:MAG: ATP-dependent DNA helicase [Bacteroidota bacterium]|nr:ATP-dependent DNA helicase [Bacteroidota bacterium]
MTPFQEAYNNLNEAQREAVDQIEGPVLVIAGPGTGKTQILATRIGHILVSDTTHAAPENILCITYTNAGVVAMRKRLLHLIGPDAYRIKIETFHSFCNDIIQQHAADFGLREMSPVTEIEVIELLRKMIDKLPLQHPLKRQGSGAYYDVARLQKLFGVMKHENWMPEYITERVGEYLKEVESDTTNSEFYYQKKYKQYNAGDAKPTAMEKLQKDMQQLIAAANLYPNYNEQLKELGRYDFNDMILWVLQLFVDRPQTLRIFQERFQYILVDEFQDTNDAQNQLVQLLCNYWPNPNVFVVGDDDQSIYRFQGANVANIFNFKQQYDAHLKVVMLRDNYRSTQQILDASKALIDLNIERITRIAGFEKLDKKLIAQREFPSNIQAPVIINYPTETAEMAGVAKHIMELIEEDTNPAEIAVIYREHRQVENLVKFFKQKEIPVSLQRKIDVLKEPFTQHLITLLNYIKTQVDRPHSNDDLLFQLFHIDFLGFGPPVEAARFMARWQKTPKTRGNINSLRAALETIANPEKPNLFSGLSDFEKSASKLSDMINHWVPACANKTLLQFFEDVITRSGALKFALHHPERNLYLQQIHALHNYITIEEHKAPGLNIARFMQSLELMAEYNITLEAVLNTGTGKGVKFTTAHSSKGLEFEHVFMVGLVGKYWEGGRRGDGFKFPPNILDHTQRQASQMAVDTDALAIEESRRLFYVGMTRAKHGLYMSYYNFDNEDKEAIPTRFVPEVEKAGIMIQRVEANDDILAEALALVMAEQKESKPELLANEEMENLLGDYKLSVSHLNAYLECPIGFYYMYLLKVPTGSAPALSFGNAVHKALERYFNKNKEEKTFDNAEELVQFFTYEMYLRKHEFVAEEYERRIEYGSDVLKQYHNHFKDKWNPIIQTEVRMEAIIFNDIPLKGFIDKLEFEGSKATVVDYKTGKFDKKKLKRPEPGNIDPEIALGGDYWRQAVFYKILLDNDPKARMRAWNFDKAVYQFIEPDKDTKQFHEETMHIVPEETGMLSVQIKDVYTRIKNHEFDKGCGECDWCKLNRRD